MIVYIVIMLGYGFVVMLVNIVECVQIVMFEFFGEGWVDVINGVYWVFCQEVDCFGFVDYCKFVRFFQIGCCFGEKFIV